MKKEVSLAPSGRESVPETVDYVVQVAVPVPFAETLSYRLAAGSARPKAGARVVVAVKNRQLVGIVTEAVPLSQWSGSGRMTAGRLKRVKKVLDTENFLPAQTLAFLQRVAAYYLTPLGEVVATALPNWFRRLPDKPPPAERWWRVARRLSSDEARQLADKAPRQWAIWQAVDEAGVILGKDLAALHPQAASLCRRLGEKGLLIEQDSCVLENQQVQAPDFTLTEGQRSALEVLRQQRGFAVNLLDGITGSGKTEVYIRAIQAQLKAGRRVLVLVPEIGLTPQLFGEIGKRIAGRVAVLHSGLSDGARAREWQNVRDGRVDVLVCTRSGIFTPMDKLGLIIVDEEHDGSFKQQDGLRYHARDLAVLRGQMENIPVILGSATPSLESLHNARQGKYHWLKLRQRTNKAPLPAIHLLNMQNKNVRSGLASEVISRIGEEIAEGNQVLVFLNRRGWSPAMLCHACGWVADCSHCDAKLTYHRRIHRLRCHHCDRHYPVPEFCPQCGSQDIHPMGEGTEKLAEMLKAELGHEAVLRVDRDTVRSANQWKSTLARIRSGEPCVMVGTQMLSKGHDFPNLTRVIVVNVDANFFSLDFRAAEKLAQLLVQVSGRAGRKDRPGEVMIQTWCPDQPLFKQLFGQGYEAFALAELEQRQAAGFPPASHMAIVRARGSQAAQVEDFLQGLAEALPENPAVAVMGPIPAPIFRKGDFYHMQLLFNSAERPALRSLLRQLRERINGHRAPGDVRWSLDIDPQELA